MTDVSLKVWRLHPSACRVEPAEKTLKGTANASAVKWCLPYSTANALGWWLFPAADIDICWKGGREFEHRVISPFTPVDAELVRSLTRPSDNADPEKWCPGHSGRTKYTFGGVEDGVVQVWTGLIFRTPPGWCLHLRSPLNVEKQPYRIMEGILETDWMQYDIWTNILFEKKDEWVSFRRDQWPPLAQIIPVRRETYREDWGLSQEMLNRDTPEGDRVFRFWAEYNTNKFASGGKQFVNTQDFEEKKNSTTFHKTRQKYVGAAAEPDLALLAPKPLKLTKKKIKAFQKKAADEEAAPGT